MTKDHFSLPTELADDVVGLPLNRGWFFGYGRKSVKPRVSESAGTASTNPVVHLKYQIRCTTVPLIASFSRGVKDVGWRCSTKTCEAKVALVQGYYRFLNSHTCKALMNETEEPHPIPTCIQEYLKMKKEDFPPKELIERIDQEQKKQEKRTGLKRKHNTC